MRETERYVCLCMRMSVFMLVFVCMHSVCCSLELGTCGYFKFLSNENFWRGHFLLSQLDWGKVILVGLAQNLTIFVVEVTI